MGGTVGLCIGLVFGTMNIIRYGPGNRGYVSTLATYMGSSAATFGFFMSIGTVIRTEPLSVEQRRRVVRPMPLYRH
jgi:NAD/NADP transhydrogenase beta subunit